MTKTPGAVVKFSRDYIFTPDEDRRTSVKYKANWQGLVRQQCADKAIAAGAAEQVKTATPRRRRAAET